MKTKKIYITGMHCVSCEKLLETELAEVPGVASVKVSYKRGEAEFEFAKKRPSFAQLQKVTQKLGYEAFKEKPAKSFSGEKEKTSPSQWLSAVLLVAAILLLFKVFQNLGIIENIELGTGKLSYGLSFMIGVVASISSCLAVVGAVVIAFGEQYQAEGESFFATAVKPNLAFHGGRLGTFFLLGGLLGLIGGELSVSGNAVAILTLFVAVVMTLLGANILGMAPSLGTLGIRIPKRFTKHWGLLNRSQHKAAPFLLGGLSFLLPCGFTQSMQIFALSSGSFLAGALNLFFFALGTVPALLLLGITASWTRSKKLIVFRKVAGFLIIIFAIYTFKSGISLLGVDAAVLQSEQQVEKVQPQKQEGKILSSQEAMVVKMSVTSRGFEPRVLKIKKGVPVRWIIQGEQISGCTNRIIVPGLEQSIDIKKGENILEFTPTKKGTLAFSCWMGMVRGKFIVE